MRVSKSERYEFNRVRSTKELLEGVRSGIQPGDLAGSLLLVGGSSPSDHIVRHAQSHLRVDHLASYWSHAALLLSLSNKPEGGFGAEVAIDVQKPELQVPERNGVTLFRLKRYLNARRYPNLAIARFSFAPAKTDESAGSASPPPPPDPRARLLDAALDPNRDRHRYRFLDWLAAWRAYTTSPFTFDNPSRDDIPHPGAAFCEYALEAAGIDITPGATAPNSCPETLWSTLRWWHSQMAATGVTFEVWCVTRDETCDSREPLATNLRGDAAEGRV